MENKSRSKKGESVFDAMPPKFAFWAGFVTAIALASVIGLVAVTSVLVGGFDDDDKVIVDKAGDTVKINEEYADAANEAPAPTVASGTIDLESLRHIQGEGDITIVEYSDFECPFCSRFHPTMKQAIEAFDGQVQWSYKHFPLNIHPNAQKAAEASECAAEQDKFWEFGDELFEAGSLNQTAYENIADDLGLDRAAFDECLSSDKYADTVKADAAEAQKYGGQGTPHSLVLDENGEILTTISGAQPYEAVEATLEQYVN